MSNKYKLLSVKYKLILPKIGSGSFGEVFYCRNKEKKLFAVKIEKIRSKTRLRDEYNAYLRIEKKTKLNSLGIPKVYDLIETPTHLCMVMQLLGKSLEDKFIELDKAFSLQTIFKIAIDCIRLIQKVHSAGILHRDIKPNNFLMGDEQDPKTLYIMDFGISKQYIVKTNKDPVQFKHIEYRTGRSLVGTARYTSHNVHSGIEPSRRDDLESIAYMLIYFLRGSLPWQGLKKEKNKSQIEKIGELKFCISPEILCNGLPISFKEFLIYSKKLNFEETPNYNFIVEMFEQNAKELKLTPQYDFN